MITRRDILVGGGVGLAAYAAGGWMPLFAQNAPNLGAPTPAVVGHRRMKLGEMEIIAVNDGVVRRPLGEEFVRNAPLGQVKELLASQKLPTDYIDVPFTAFVVVAGNRHILMDTGFADNGPPTTGRLLMNLAAAGLKPEDIDTVLISHYHGDHILGLRNKAGQLTCPRARIMVPAPEHAFWMDDARMNAAPEAQRGAFQVVRRMQGGLTDQQLVRFEPGTEVAPGVQSMAAFGHTPGHTLFTARSGGQSFIYAADCTNIPELFARSPDWAVVFDMNADQARETRRRVFDMIVREKMTAGGFHFPFPAFGTIAQMGSGYNFTPVA